MEAEESQELQSASWRPSRTDVYFQAESKNLRTRSIDGICSSSKAGSLETQEEPMFSLKSKAAKAQCPSSNSQVRGVPSYSAFLFCTDIQLMG